MIEINAESSITEVTVYNDRALVTRSAELQLEAGETTLLFKVPFHIDENSIRASGSGGGILKITGSGTKIIHHRDTSDISFNELEDKLEDLNEEYNKIQSKISVKELKKNSLLSTAKECETSIPRGIRKGTFDINMLSSSAEYIFPLVEAIDEEILQLRKKLKVMEKDIKYNRKIQEKFSRPSMLKEKSVFVNAEAASASTYNIQIQYVISGASWYPVYDARVDFPSRKAELISLGMISQNTGEDWNNVKLRLSTARPGNATEPPQMDPLYVKFNKKEIPVRPLQRAGVPDPFASGSAPEEQFDSTEDDIMMDLSSDFDEAVPDFPAENVKADLDAAGTSVNYIIKNRADIPTDGEYHRQTISVNDFQAEFDYISVPRFDLNAYLRSKIKNVSENIFLPGDIQIFLDNHFIGKGKMKLTSPGEILELFLGADDSIRIERNLIEDDIGKAGLLKGSIKQNFEYSIKIQNLKKESFPFTIIDQIPVAKEADISVNAAKIKPEPHEHKKNNIIHWKKELSSGENWEISVRYSVEYPAGREITNLRQY